MNKELLENIKKTTVFIGTIGNDRKETFIGTGVLCNINNVYYMLTAKHVIGNVDTNGNIISERAGLSVFLNINIPGYKVKAVSLDGMKKEGYKYIYHSKSQVDLAIIPIKLNFNTDDVKLIGLSDFSVEINNLFETNEIFCSSYQPGISSLTEDGNIKPIIRKGIIARINNDKTFYIDSSAFPGNSGSGVFLMPSPFQYNGNLMSLGGDINGGKFIGIVNSYIPYQDVAISNQTGRPRVIFEENTGLSKITSFDLVKEIINQDDFKGQEKTILEQSKK